MFDPYHKWLGVPKKHRPPTFYQLLGIEADETDTDVIDEAAIRQSAHVRTYQIGEHAELCTRLLNEISEARGTLLNPAKRKNYDAELAKKKRSATKPKQPAASPPGISVSPPQRESTSAFADLDVAPAAENPLRKSLASSRRSHRNLIISGVGFGFLMLVLILAGTAWWLSGIVFRIATPEGTVLVDVNQPGATVSVDAGKIIVKVPGEKEPVKINLKKGKHTLFVSKGGFKAETREITINPGQPQRIHVRLEPVRVAQGKTPRKQPPAVKEEANNIVDQNKTTPAKDHAWVSLFNGKDLDGWKAPEESDWRVENGVLTWSSQNSSQVWTERDDYTDFHLRAEVRISHGQYAHINIRETSGPRLGAYVVILNCDNPNPNKTGSLILTGQGAAVNVAKSPVRPGEWFTLEVIARGNHAVVQVNGQTTADYSDPKRRYTRGRITLLAMNQAKHRQRYLEFRKIEIKELSPRQAKTDPIPESQPPNTIGPHPTPEVVKAAPWSGRAQRSYNGHWKIEGNEIVQTTHMAACALVFGDFSWTDYDFSCEAKQISGGVDVGLLYRVTGSVRGIFICGARGNKVHSVSSGNAHGPELFYKSCPGMMEKDRWYKLKVQLRGTSCRCFIDDKLVLEYKETNATHGAVGMRTWHTSARFRNIRVTDPNGKILFEGVPESPAAADQWPPATELRDDRELFCLKGHGAPVLSVTFSHDGKQLLSGANGERSILGADGKARIHHGPGNAVRLWDAETGRTLDNSIKREKFWHGWACVKLVAARNTSGFLCAYRFSVRVAGVTDGKLDIPFRFPGNVSSADVAYSPDGRRAMALRSDGSFWEWDLADKKLIRQLPGRFKNVTCAALAPNGRSALLARKNQPFAEIDLATGKETGRWKNTRHRPVNSMAFSSDGRLLVTGHARGTVRLWDVTATKELHAFLGLPGSGHQGAVLAADISPDGKYALTGGRDRTVRLWDLVAKKQLACFRGHTGPVRSVAFSPDGLRAASGSADYTIRLWRLPLAK